MSQSRSTTPTSNTSSANLNPSSDWTTSRTPPHVHFPSHSTLLEGDQPPSSHSTRIYSLPPPSRSIPSSSTGPRMTRRLQGDQTVSRPVSEFNHAHNDAASINKRDGPSEPAAPPKKKRTRTLTTPHQAAVLHALLAKSRFPNTAVREEVGRSIGLSARKVQIWFQNQRQKARRPHSQTDMSRKKPPHFSAFPSSSGTSALGSFPLAPEPSSNYSPMSRSAEMARSVARSEYYSLDPSSDWRESSSRLSGPGMPGLESSSDSTYRRQRVIPSRPSTAYEGLIRYSDPRDQSVRLSSPVHSYLPPRVSHPTTTGRLYDRDSSRTLPPLVFPSTPPRSSFSAPGPSPGQFHAAFHLVHTERRSLSPQHMFSYHPPESVASVTQPPYVVQPQLQLPTSVFEPILRSSYSPSWALREHDLASRSITPVPATERPPTTEEDVQPTEVRLPQRSGRYDPIRGTFIYSSPPEENH